MSPLNIFSHEKTNKFKVKGKERMKYVSIMTFGLLAMILNQSY